MSPVESLPNWAKRYGPFALLAALLVWHSLQYNFVTDDAYISFVFSHNFAEHGELVFSHGHPPVEGYTNFLWTFLLGLLMVVGLPPDTMSLILGTGFGIGGMWMAFRLVSHLREEESGWDYLAPALLAMSSGYACWSSGGLETQMFTFFVTASLYSYARADEEPRFYRWLGACLALAAMTRPEGLLVAGVVGGHHLIANLVREKRIVPTRPELEVFGVFLLIWGPWFAWRAWYYGHLFPNTYYVKAAGKASKGYAEKMAANGRYYVWQWLTQSKMLYGAPLAVVGFALAGLRSRRLYLGTVALLLGGAYIVYTMRVGGDFMGLHRFVMPLFVIGALGVALGLARLVAFVPDAKIRLGVGLVASAVLLGAFGVTQMRLTKRSTKFGNWRSDRGIDTPSYLAIYAHDRRLIGEQMKSCFREDDFSIFGGVGAKPFAAEAKGVDVFGLVSDVVAHEVPRTRPRAGHNKWGPDKLMYESYEPEFVFHCYSIHRDPAKPRINCCPRSDPSCERGNSFWQRKGYERVTMHIPGMKERGEYYTFFVREDRAPSFKESCEGVIE